MNIFRMVPAVFILTAFASCASIPPLATVSSGGKNVELKNDSGKKSLDKFAIIKKAVISPDRRYILLVNVDGGSWLFDTMNDRVLNDPGKAAALEALKCPDFHSSGMYNYPPYASADNRYRVSVLESKGGMTGSGQEHFNSGSGGMIYKIELTDTKTSSNSTVAMPAIWQFGKDRLAYLHIPGYGAFFVVESLPERNVLKKYPIAATLSMGDYGRYYASFSTDANSEVILFHNGRLVQFYDFRSGNYLGSIMPIDTKNWFAISATGEYDGTEESFDLFYWDLGGEKLPVNKFDKSFRRQNVLARIVGLQKGPAGVDLGKQLIGKVREIKGGEIIVSSGSAAETIKMGDRVFVIIDGQKAVLEVKFPMQTIAKCAVAPASAKFRDRIAAGMPVFK
ncbi:MAG: hypothetical protein MUD12_12825 [Spirochaetes bacterium]|nr:hypothetical protein [Spirochaetota bacterium]